MKPLIVKLLVFALLLLPMSTVGAAQEAVRLTASAVYEQSSHSIQVSGQLSSGAGQWITVQLLDDHAAPVYFNQLTSGDQGAFALSIYVPDPVAEHYELRLGALGLAEVTKVAIDTATTQPPTPTPTPTDNGSGTGGQTQKEIVIQVNSVTDTNAAGESVSIAGLSNEQLASALANALQSTLIIQSNGTENIQQLQVILSDLQSYYASGALNTIVFQNSLGSYKVSLKELFAAATQTGLAGQLVIELAEVKDAGVVSRINQAGQQISDAVSFSMLVKSGASSKEMMNQTGYTSRTIPLGQSVDVSKAAAVLYDPISDTVRPVPAVFEFADGSWRAVIKHNGAGIYAVVQNNKQFADLANHWSKKDVELLANRLIVNGISESSFNPDGNVTRAEFAALLVRALGLDAQAEEGSFTDVRPADWYAKAVQAAVQAGLVSGYENGEFRPTQSISREEMTIMLQRAAKLAGLAPIASSLDYKQVTNGFKDSSRTQAWAENALAEAIQRGWVQGRSSDVLAPNGKATRAESTVMLKRLLLDLQFINS